MQFRQAISATYSELLFWSGGIPQVMVRNLVVSMRQRVLDVRASKGGHTRYWIVRVV